jgi:hypothetical protein
VSSVVNLRTFVNASNVPIVVLTNIRREYLAEPRLFHRYHKVTYPCDASASHALDDMAAHETCRAFSQDFPAFGER